MRRTRNGAGVAILLALALMAGSAAGSSTTSTDRVPPPQPPPLPPPQPADTSSATPTVDHTAGMSDADVMAAAAGMFPGGMAGLAAMSGNVPLHQRVAAAHTASRSAHTPGAVVPPAGPVPSYDPYYNPTDPGLVGPMPTEETSVPGPPGPPVSSLPSVQGAPVRMGRILAVRPGGMADVVIDSTNEIRPVVIANADRVHFEPGDSVRVAGWIAHVVR